MSSAERLILREAFIRLRDLEHLASCVVDKCDELLTKLEESPEAGPSPEQLLELLRCSNGSDPTLAKWFADNPSPQLAGITTVKGFKIGVGEKDDYVESPDETRLRLDTELFYYLAHRFCSCLSLLPGLTKFKCKEIAVIRNQLLEHPEGNNSGVLLPAFAYRTNDGPVMKGVRLTGQANVHPDAGFVPNCAALIGRAAEALTVAST